MNIRLRPDRSLTVEKTRVGRVPTLILRPASTAPAQAGLLWIHGGGYITGMKEMVYMSRGADLVRGYGVTVFSPGYRLAWLHPYPAAADDCFSVLEYQTDFRGLPPCYTFVGDGEPFYSETLQYVENLRAAGVEAEADVFHTDMHAFDMLRPDDPVSREAISRLHTRFESFLFSASPRTDRNS